MDAMVLVAPLLLISLFVAASLAIAVVAGRRLQRHHAIAEEWWTSAVGVCRTARQVLAGAAIEPDAEGGPRDPEPIGSMLERLDTELSALTIAPPHPDAARAAADLSAAAASLRRALDTERVVWSGAAPPTEAQRAYARAGVETASREAETAVRRFENLARQAGR